LIKNCFRKAGIVEEQEDETLVEDITEHNTIGGWEEIYTEPTST
jgi:hypothetical protein